MSKLVITQERFDFVDFGSLHEGVVAQMKLPDDEEVVAIIMEAAASAVQEYFERQRRLGVEI